MKTAVAAPPPPSDPLYVFQLEETIRQLGRILREEGVPIIRSDHPEDHGLDVRTARIVEELLDGWSDLHG